MLCKELALSLCSPLYPGNPVACTFLGLGLRPQRPEAFEIFKAKSLEREALAAGVWEQGSNGVRRAGRPCGTGGRRE